MQFTELFFLALGLSLDAFAIAVSSSSNGNLKSKRAAVRLSFHFGLFQALMPLAGWFLGKSIESFVVNFDHWIAFILLCIIGFKMIIESFKKDNKELKGNPSKGWNLILYSLATSIDALAIGFSLALLEVNIIYAACVIGIVTATVSLTGIYIGSKLGLYWGKRMELLGGVILLTIGLKILISHLIV